MREERGQLSGDLDIREEYTLWGSVAGRVSVGEGGKFYLRGSIYGDLLMDFGGRAHVYGQVQGNVEVNRGAKLIISGVIGGHATNFGGRLYIDELGIVRGRVKTIKGETQIHPSAKVES
jgi:predicted acyltransferase (DUF342 family)